MIVVYDKNASSVYQVKFRLKQYHWCREFIENNPKSGRHTSRNENTGNNKEN